MQAVTAISTVTCRAAAAPLRPALPARSAVRRPAARMQVSCSAAPKQSVAAAAVSAVTLVAAHPALAVVDDRLYGEGTGQALGLSDPVLIWVIAGVFGAVWALFYTANLPKYDKDDSGLDL
eukprot:jgi/Chlat1/1270/Chrsp115S01698